MSLIHCYHCFARFPPEKLHFKCQFHAGSERFFAMPRTWLRRKPPRRVLCPRCGRYTSYRVCPNPVCRHDLPHYVGRASQQIVAVTGCRDSGKTVFHWSLLHQLRTKRAQEEDPFVVAMFEDDRSFSIWHTLHERIYAKCLMPEPTRAKDQKAGEFEPVIIRLFPRHRPLRKASQTNLIFYDHAGELVEALDNAFYLRYLAHAAALIFLVDLDHDPEWAGLGLMAVARSIRTELRIRKEEKISKPLAVVLTKGDQSVLPQALARHDVAELITGSGSTAGFWHGWDGASRRTVRRASEVCEDLVRERGLHNFVAMARLNFHELSYFAVSSLGGQPQGDQLPNLPNPIGTELPLFWCLCMLN